MTLSWLSIIRLGLVQMCLGAVVVLMTSTLNRLMVVELSLAATIPGALVAIHYLVQISRPKWGFISDVQGNRTKWIILGMIILALGANLAAVCIPFGGEVPAPGLPPWAVAAWSRLRCGWQWLGNVLGSPVAPCPMPGHR